MQIKRFSPLCKYLFSAQKINSVPGHKPPAIADTPAGRYAGSLFTSASKSEVLQTVLKDIKHLQKVIQGEPAFRQFLKNSAIKRAQQKEVIDCFAKDHYNSLTQNMLGAVIEAGRLSDLEKIAETYIAYCKILNKEEDIRVISAKELNQEEKDQVVAAYKQNKPDTKFRVSYEVDSSILGGLQIFAGTEFLDCSLRSRLQKLKTEVQKLA